jgi:hypothetical protein
LNACIPGAAGTEADVANSIFVPVSLVRSPDKSKSKGVFIEIINDITEQKHMQEELVRTEKMAGIARWPQHRP